MKAKIIAAAWAVAACCAAALPASAQTAGSTTVAEVKAVADGWSVLKQFIGATVYNEDEQKVGKIEDMIVAPDGSLSHAIVGVGGFVGIGVRDVAVPVRELHLMDGKMVLPGATKDVVKRLPEFKYASPSERKQI